MSGTGVAQVAAVQTARRFGAGLPQDPPFFGGRRAELARLREEIGRAPFAASAAARSGTAGPAPSRVLVVAGRPGSGRTSLAVHFARSVAEDYPDGQFFVRLSEPGGGPLPADRVARQLLAALGEPVGEAAEAAAEPPGPDPAAAGHPDCAALRAALAERRVLLVLDDAGSSEQLRALLPDAPGCLVVAVTAGPLTGVADARPCVLGGLDVRTSLALLTGFAGDTRIVCDPVAARGLVENLGCHPGALRLVGGWLRTCPNASVADALRLLTESSPRISLVKQPGAALRDAEPLRRAFDLAYDGLSAQAARLLRLLALAPAGRAEPRTAAALLGCPVDAATAHLAALAERRLVNPYHPGSGFGTGADPDSAAAPGAEPQHDGYQLPESLRAPLLGLLAADRASETELARARVLERLVRLLGACVHRLAPGGGPEPEPLPAPLRFGSAADAWHWLDSELPVLRSALRIALADGALDGLAMRLATGLVRALPLWSGGSEAVATDLYELHESILELARRGGLPRQQAAALVNLGDLHARRGQHGRALERYRAGLGPARSVEDQVAVGRILEAVAGAYRASGDLVRAVDWYGRALALRRTRGERADELRLLGRLAAAHTAQGRFGEALREYRAAIALHRKLGDQEGALGAILGSARVQEQAGHAEQALRTQREALASARELDAAGDGHRLEALVLVRMAEGLERAGDPAGARAQREQAAALGLPATRRAEPAGADSSAADSAETPVPAEVTTAVSE